MLVIRKEQMAALDAYMHDRFRRRLREFLRTNLREELRERSDADLMKLIEECLVRSARYHLTSERDISMFACLMVQHSPEFEERREMLWAKKILLKPNLPGQAKLAMISQMLSARQAPSENA